MKKKGVYDDKFRSSAVIMLEAAGYPNQKGALERTAKAVGIHARTLSRWFNGEQNPPPDRMVNKKRLELTDLLRNELGSIFKAMPNARPDASYRDLGTVAAIFIDKLQLLEGKPTWRGEVIDLLKSGKVTPEQVENELGSDIAQELFESIGLSVVGIREAQAAIANSG